jgi:hypothetical protein
MWPSEEEYGGLEGSDGDHRIEARPTFAPSRWRREQKNVGRRGEEIERLKRSGK